MKITETDAVYHIVNSLDSTNANYWRDDVNGITWGVSGNDDGVLEFTFTNDEDDVVSEQRFRLVEE